MKKTIIALLALGSGVMGATLTTQDITGYVIANGSEYTDWNTNLSITLNSNGDLVFTGSELSSQYEWFDTTSQTTKYRTISTVAITLNLEKLESPEQLSALLTLDGKTHDTGLGMTTSRAVTGTWDTNLQYTMPSGTLPTQGSVTITYSFTSDGTTIYMDDRVHGNSSGLKGDLEGIQSLKLASFAIDALEKMTVYSKGSYNDASFGASAAALNAAIPEPTTATLSLLALAGLAARRRRR